MWSFLGTLCGILWEFFVVNLSIFLILENQCRELRIILKSLFSSNSALSIPYSTLNTYCLSQIFQCMEDLINDNFEL